MTFFDRYLEICADKNIQPYSQKAADLFGVTKATITTWRKNNSIPKGDTLINMADALQVSVDYLLGRTDNPVNYDDMDLQAELAGPVMDELNGDTEKALAFQRACAEDAARETRPASATRIQSLYNQLDFVDQIRVEAYIEGVLAADKYRRTSEKLG